MAAYANTFIYVIIYLNFTNCVQTFDLSGMVAKAWDSLVTYCWRSECCTNEFITADFKGLLLEMESKFYGQDLALETVFHALRDHWKIRNPRKALTLSFHGPTGTGKTYLTGILKEFLFKKAGYSRFVHHFTARIHFTRNKKINIYKDELYSWIKGNVSECPRQLFIFDEVEEMPEGILDVLKPMIDYHDNIDHVDYRKVIFIFLSNTGASAITEAMLKLWKQGKDRNDIKLSDFEKLISKGAFNEKGGFHYCDTIKSNLIDHYVPFLPMEFVQVKKCIQFEFQSRGVYHPNESDIQEVMDFVPYGPEPENIFATTGCKSLSQKVGVIASRYSAEL